MLPISSASITESNQVCLYTANETNVMKKLLTIQHAEFNNDVDSFRKEYNSFYNFLCRYKNKSIQLDDPKLMYWLNHVVPSCIYPIRFNGTISHYSCAICQAVMRTQASLIRHYQEQHFEQLPSNIFGIKIIYSCDTCSVNFNRANQLEQHKLSVKHLNKVGNSQAEEVLSSFKEAKSAAALLKKHKRKVDQAIEETTWNKKKKLLQEQNAEPSEHGSDGELPEVKIIEAQESEIDDEAQLKVDNLKDSESTSKPEATGDDNEDDDCIDHAQTHAKKKECHRADVNEDDDLTCSQLSQLSVKN